MRNRFPQNIDSLPNCVHKMRNWFYSDSLSLRGNAIGKKDNVHDFIPIKMDGSQQRKRGPWHLRIRALAASRLYNKRLAAWQMASYARAFAHITLSWHGQGLRCRRAYIHTRVRRTTAQIPRQPCGFRFSSFEWGHNYLSMCSWSEQIPLALNYAVALHSFITFIGTAPSSPDSLMCLFWCPTH